MSHPWYLRRSNENTNMHASPNDGKDGGWKDEMSALNKCLPPTRDSKAAIPPCEVGTLTVTILLLAGNGSLVVTTFPPTEVPVIWKVCPLDVATVVSVPATHKANKQRNYNKYCYYSNP